MPLPGTIPSYHSSSFLDCFFRNQKKSKEKRNVFTAIIFGWFYERLYKHRPGEELDRNLSCLTTVVGVRLHRNAESQNHDILPSSWLPLLCVSEDPAWTNRECRRVTFSPPSVVSSATDEWGTHSGSSTVDGPWAEGAQVHHSLKDLVSLWELQGAPNLQTGFASRVY